MVINAAPTGFNVVPGIAYDSKYLSSYVLKWLLIVSLAENCKTDGIIVIGARQE